MKITGRELKLAVALALMGFVLSEARFILWLDTLNPLEGLIIYYIILYASLYTLSKAGLVVFNVRIEDPAQTFGLLLVTFSFFLTCDWESPYVQIITRGSIGNVSQVYWQAEDGACWYLWTVVMGVADIGLARILTFVVTPFALALIGCLFIEKKVQLSA